MDDPILELRQWLRALTPDEARQLAEVQRIRRTAQLAQNTSARRAASSIQAWAARTTVRELKSLAEFGVGRASEILAADGWPAEVIGDPNRNQLVDMLATLEPAVAVPALLGLVAGAFPASALAAAEADELFAIARSRDALCRVEHRTRISLTLSSPTTRMSYRPASSSPTHGRPVRY